MSLALSFLGGAPFQLLYDGVKKAISTTRNFRTQLINLEFTLGCLQPRIILQISNNNVQLSLPNDIIQDLQVKMNEGIDLVASLSKLSIWNIRIWVNCCNCLKPNYAEQLEDLDRSLNRLLELLRLEQIRNVTLLMLRLDDIERTQSDILQALQDIPGYISRAQEEVIQRMQVNVEQQVRNGEGRAAAPAPVVGVVFEMLYDVVTKVKVKNLMFNRLLGELTYSLDCLKPLIEEIANNNKVLHLPVLDLEDFVMEMEKAVEFVHKCSKVSKQANYRKYQWTNKLLQLDEHLQRLFIDFNGQLELKVKEAMDLVSNIEAVMNQTKGSSVVETHVIESDGHSPLPQPHSPSVRLDLQNMLGTGTHVIEKTLVDTAEITEETQESNVKLHVKNVQGASDVVKETLKSARNLEVGDIITEGTSSTRNVEETSELEEILERFGESDARMRHNQTEIVDQHEPPEHIVQLEVRDVCGTRLKDTVTALPFATRPSCYSSTASSEIVELESLNLNFNFEDSGLSPEEEEMMRKLSSVVIVEQEEAVISLRKLTRTKEDLRVSLCTQRLLSALKSLIVSRYSTVQVNAVASLVNLSLEKPNKVKIVRSGFIPPLVDVLKSGSSESQEHAAGALLSLALEEDNKMAIGVLGALPPLMHALIRAESERTRHDSALALYHLTLVESNRIKLVKLNSVPTLLALSKAPGSAGRVLLILCNLAICGEGRSAMLDANAVECLVGMLRRNELDSESTRENCVAALYALSHRSMRFWGLAREANAVEVLSEIEKRGSERAREKAKRLLMILRSGGGGRPEEGGLDWEGVLDSGTGVGLGGTGYKVGPGRSLHAANSTTF